MIVQQAIFTSTRSGRNEGYQIASSSPGISTEELRELAKWGPSHDSLYGNLSISESVNSHRMESGLFCVSQSVLAGREYSGRGGQRVYTQMFLVPQELLERFGNSPFRVIESLAVSGRLTVEQTIPAQLEPLKLIGRASLVNTTNLKQVMQKTGPEKLASLVSAALNTDLLGVCSPVSGKRLFSALLDLLPPAIRSSFSLTTGLQITATRKYRLAVLPQDSEEHRRAIRQVRLSVLDLTGDLPTKFAPNSGWPLMIHQLLRAEQFSTIAEVIKTTLHSPEQDVDLLAEEVRERLDKHAEQAALTPFSA